MSKKKASASLIPPLARFLSFNIPASSALFLNLCAELRCPQIRADKRKEKTRGGIVQEEAALQYSNTTKKR